MTDHVHSYECTKSGRSCHRKFCNSKHPTIPDVPCTLLAKHDGDHGGFGPAMKQIRWSAA